MRRARSRAVLEGVPGITTNIGQPIEHRLSHILSGTPAAIAVSVYGDDLATLRVIAKEIEAALSDPLPGARDIAANREVMIQSLPGGLPAAGACGVWTHPAIRGRAGAERDLRRRRSHEVNEGVRRYSLVVRLNEQPERDSESRISGGSFCEDRAARSSGCGEVAVIGPEMTSNLITRENAQRKAVISLNVAAGLQPRTPCPSRCERRVDPIVQPPRLHASQYGGQFEAQQSATRTIGLLQRAWSSS